MATPNASFKETASTEQQYDATRKRLLNEKNWPIAAGRIQDMNKLI
jgi:hypothetical protein